MNNYFLITFIKLFFFFDIGLTELVNLISYFFTKFKIILLYNLKKIYINIIQKINNNLNLLTLIYLNSNKLMLINLNYYLFFELYLYIFKDIFLNKLGNKYLAPSLNIYFPIKSSIFSVTLRITGVFITLILGV